MLTYMLSCTRQAQAVNHNFMASFPGRVENGLGTRQVPANVAARANRGVGYRVPGGADPPNEFMFTFCGRCFVHDKLASRRQV